MSLLAVCCDLKFLVKYCKYEKSNKMTILKIDCTFVHINDTAKIDLRLSSYSDYFIAICSRKYNNIIAKSD